MDTGLSLMLVTTKSTRSSFSLSQIGSQMMMKVISVWSMALLLAGQTSSFTQHNNAARTHIAQRRPVSGTALLQQGPPFIGGDGGGGGGGGALQDDAEAAVMALSNYLVKAHVEKLKATQQVEAEIDALKNELQQLKTAASSSNHGSSSIIRNTDPASLAIVAQYQQSDPVRTRVLEQLSKEELMARILQYQDQMQAYMVKSLEERQKAVAMAQITAQQKVAETIQILTSAAVAEGGRIGSSSSSSPIPSSALYQARGAAMSRAGAAGKSRWGAQEVAKVTSNAPVGRNSSAAGAGASAVPKVVVVSAVVEEQQPKTPRILPSSRAVFGGGAAPPPKVEVVTAATTVPVMVVVPDETLIAAADHGLRADGGVAGPSLAERLTKGSDLATGASSSSSRPEPDVLPHFAMRKAKVQAAASQNKSRWGTQEVNRLNASIGSAPTKGGSVAAGRTRVVANPSGILQTSVATLNGAMAPTSSLVSIDSSTTTTTPVALLETIEAADHGLRADGGVDGMTLLARVTKGADTNDISNNVGAQMVQKAKTAAVINKNDVSSSSSLYTKRNAKVNAAPAEKSRWGAAERHKIQNSASTIGTMTTTLRAGSSSSSSSSSAAAAAPGLLFLDSSDVVVTAADHGLRADGGVGGPTLTERLNFGAALVATAVAVPKSTSGSASSILYEMRNAKVTKAQGKSRWGGAEIQKIQLLSSTSSNNAAAPASSTASLPPADAAAMVREADHGLRADGGVGGPTLAERVAAGASATRSQPSVVVTSSLYGRRNAKVQAAAAAGKSVRWGGQEIERIIQTAAAGTSSSMVREEQNGKSTLVTMPVQRVNFGATLVRHR
jgi:hypothetical protein